MVNYLDIKDNIVALATADGLASVSIIRVSGKNLSKVYQLITKKKGVPKSNSICFYKIYSPQDKSHLDDGLISYFTNKSSFTGEDVLEINCHGGNYVASNIIKHIVMSQCARHALPGEFSFRAFYNGKIDLVQAESINDLIESETNIYAEKALDNINGKLSEIINEIKNITFKTITLIEHELDFNEEEIVFTKNKDIIKPLINIRTQLEKIESTSLHSKIIRNGIRILILGKPNVGKSSLFNYLMGHKRALVSNVAGTTRDTIESVFEIQGYRVTIIDSAGILETVDNIEKMAMEKTRDEIKRSNIIIVLGDNAADLNRYDKRFKNKNIIKVLSKSDIINYQNKNNKILKISSVNGDGIEELLTLLSTKIKGLVRTRNRSSEFLINERHYNIIKESKNYINQAILGLENNITHDITADLLHQFISVFNNISSPVDRNDILNNIFSNFCVGK